MGIQITKTKFTRMLTKKEAEEYCGERPPPIPGKMMQNGQIKWDVCDLDHYLDTISCDNNEPTKEELLNRL